MKIQTETIDEILNKGADDKGNADSFLILTEKHFVYTISHGWLMYNGKFWEQNEAELDKEIMDCLFARRHAAVTAQKEQIVKATATNVRQIFGCKRILQSLLFEDINNFDTKQYLLNCDNGVVDLRTKKIEKHHHTQRFTYCLQWSYEKNIEYSKWESFLLESVAGGQEVVDYLRMCVGYSLTGETTEETLFYIKGPGRSGKGTFTETLLKLMGKKMSSECDFNSFTKLRDNDASNFDLAGLKQARFVVASESNKYQSLNPAKIKALTGGNSIRCAFKYKDHFEYTPQYKIWLVSNHSINADPQDEAIWARVRVILFPNSHIGNEDPRVKSQMKSDQNMPVVLSWAVQGAYEWYTKETPKIPVPYIIRKETEENRIESDTIAQWFEECCEFDQNKAGQNEGESGAALTSNCKLWHEAHGYDAPHPKSIASFFRDVKGYEYNKLVKPRKSANFHDEMVDLVDKISKPRRICPGITIVNYAYDQYGRQRVVQK